MLLKTFVRQLNGICKSYLSMVEGVVFVVIEEEGIITGLGVWVRCSARSDLGDLGRDSERTWIGVNDSSRAPTI